MLGILCDSLGSFLSPYTHITMLAMGNVLFHSSSTGLMGREVVIRASLREVNRVPLSSVTSTGKL